MNSSMLAARLHGPRELRVERIAAPAAPAAGEVLVRITAVGICGSDLQMYQDAGLADVLRQRPLVLGHELAGWVSQAGEDAIGGDGTPLTPGMRVAIDPAQSCGGCERCREGNPNLCERLHFCGVHPDDGGLCQWLRVPARNCFPLPPTISDDAGALTEPLGVALHATDLAHLRVGESVAILGAGPLGLCILQVVRLAGAASIVVSDKFTWRLDHAQRHGATPVDAGADPVKRVHELTGGRGVDVVIEAAWADLSVQQATEMCRAGGRLVLVGIPRDDRLTMSHAVARRKGLTIRLCRRMKHAYPRSIGLVASGAVDLEGLVSHRFRLQDVPAAFALNAAYEDRVVKAMVRVGEEA